jgi:hypothetical protein
LYQISGNWSLKIRNSNKLQQKRECKRIEYSLQRHPICIMPEAAAAWRRKQNSSSMLPCLKNYFLMSGEKGLTAMLPERIEKRQRLTAKGWAPGGQFALFIDTAPTPVPLLEGRGTPYGVPSTDCAQPLPFPSAGERCFPSHQGWGL